jgi:hypothetical protein
MLGGEKRALIDFHAGSPVSKDGNVQQSLICSLTELGLSISKIEIVWEVDLTVLGNRPDELRLLVDRRFTANPRATGPFG